MSPPAPRDGRRMRRPAVSESTRIPAAQALPSGGGQSLARTSGSGNCAGAGDGWRPFGVDGFATTLEEVGKLLADTRLPVALYLLTAEGEAVAELAGVVERAFEPVAFIGRLDGATVGLLYVGPHAATHKGRRHLHHLITRTVRLTLGHASPANTAVTFEVRVVHCASDALLRPDALLEILAGARAQRLPHHTLPS